MGSEAGKRLLELVKNIEPPSPGIALDTIAKVQINDKIISDIVSCIYAANDYDVGWGLWFCKGLFLSGNLDNGIVTALIKRLPSLISSANHDLKSEVVLIMVLLRSRIPEFRVWMLQCLKDTSPDVRNNALLNSQFFLNRGEIEPLLVFKDDMTMVEVSMNGPWVYSLRNEALVRIEESAGKQFKKKECSEITKDGIRVYWWDWAPFLEWWNKRQSGWRAWFSIGTPGMTPRANQMNPRANQ